MKEKSLVNLIILLIAMLNIYCFAYGLTNFLHIYEYEDFYNHIYKKRITCNYDVQECITKRALWNAERMRKGER